MSSPLVSVVIPAHNAGSFLGEAIESVLDQGHRPIEITVIDDGSTDETAEVARSYGDAVRLLRQPHSGTGASRNLGVAHSSGEFIAFLDADDLWKPEKLQLQLERMAAGPRVDLVFGMIDHFSGEPGASGPLLPGHLIITLLARAAALRQVGPFSTELRQGEFIAWLLRARQHGLREATLPDHVASRRLHPGNHSREPLESYASELPRLLKAGIDARRRAGRSEP